MQFHPTCLFHPQATSFLISEAVRGEGGVLRNSRGDDFTARVHPRGSLAPRDVVARAIDAEMKRSGAQCVLSRHHAPTARVPAGAIPPHLRDLSAQWHRHGEGTNPGGAAPRITNVAESKPNVDGATSLPGSVRRSGRWPALVCMGQIDWRATRSRRAGYCSSRVRRRSSIRVRRPIRPGPISLPEWKSGDVQNVDELVVIYHNWDEIRRLMWDYVGIVRTDKTAAAGERAPAQFAARDPGILLEFPHHGGPARSCATSRPSRPLIVDSGTQPEGKPRLAFHDGLSGNEGRTLSPGHFIEPG